MNSNHPKTSTRTHTRRIEREYIVRRGLAALPPSDRPREKLQLGGRQTLSDHEVLALVLGHGLPGRGALQLSADLLECTGGIHGLARTSVDQLAALDGIGAATAAPPKKSGLNGPSASACASGVNRSN